MSARDPLAEHIYQAAFDRNVLIDRKDCAALAAAAARDHIADEINAKYEAEKPTLKRWDPRDEGYEDGLDIAEQIARGELT